MKIIIDDSVEKFIILLKKETIAKVLRIIDLLELFGSKLSMPHSKKIIEDVYELRIRGRQEVRIFYIFREKTAILLHGFVKKSSKIPKKEIDAAISKARRLTER